MSRKERLQESIDLIDLADSWLDNMAVALRPLRLWHAGICWRLAHDKVVRKVSYTQEPPTVRQHLKWMWRWAGPGRTHRGWLVVASAGGEHYPLGIVRVGPDRYEPVHHEVHIALFAWARGVHYGRQALQAVRAWYNAHRTKQLHAYIKETNERAQRAFTAAGYRRVGPARDGYVCHVAERTKES